MTDLNLQVLKYTAHYCAALVDNYLVDSINIAERTLKLRPNSKSTQERLNYLKLGICKLSFYFETGRKYHKVIQFNHIGDCTTHAFIDKMTGDLYKPASHKAPQKLPNFNLCDVKQREWLFNNASYDGKYWSYTFNSLPPHTSK